jgi:hypothetical protein
MKKCLINWIVLLCVALAAGCGGDTPSSEAVRNTKDGGNAQRDQAAPSKLECNSAQCDATTQYCLLSKKNNAFATSECTPLPKNCISCDCATTDAPNHFPTSGNCSGTIGCTRVDGAVTVTCYVP